MVERMNQQDAYIKAVTERTQYHILIKSMLAALRDANSELAHFAGNARSVEPLRERIERAIETAKRLGFR